MGFMLQLFLGLALILTTPPICATKDLNNTFNLTTTILTTTESSNRDINKLIKNEIEKKSKSEQRGKIISFNHHFENNTITKEKTAPKNYTDQKKSDNVVRETSSRAIDVSSLERYTSDDFQNKNNVYTLPESSPSAERFYKNEDFDFLTTEHPKFEIFTEITTPRTDYYDKKYKETVDSVAQNLDHHFNIHGPGSLENLSSEEKSIEQNLSFGNKDNGTRIQYLKTRNIEKNQTLDNNTIHKDLVVEQTRHIAIEQSFNDKQSYEESNTTPINENISTENHVFNVVIGSNESSNENPERSSEYKSKYPTDSTAIASGKSTVVQTTQKASFTKPPNNKNNSHILSNNIESETIKAFKLEPVASGTSASGKLTVATEKTTETTTENSKTTTLKSRTTSLLSDSLESSKQRENQIEPFQKNVETSQYTITTAASTPSVFAKTVTETTSTATEIPSIARETSSPVAVTTSTVVTEMSNGASGTTYSVITTDKPEEMKETTLTAENNTTEADTTTSPPRSHQNTVVTLGKEPSTVSGDSFSSDSGTVSGETASSDLFETTTVDSKTSTVVSEITTEVPTSTMFPTTLELTTTTTTTTEYDFTTLALEKETNRSVGNSTRYFDTTDYEYRTSKGFTVDTEAYTSTEHSEEITSTEIPSDVETTTLVSTLSDAAVGQDTSKNAVIKEHMTTSSTASKTVKTTTTVPTTIKIMDTSTASRTVSTTTTMPPTVKTMTTSTPSRTVSTTTTMPTTVKIMDYDHSSIELQKNLIPKDNITVSESSEDTVIANTSQNTITTENDLEGTGTTTAEDDSTNEVMSTESVTSGNEGGGNNGTVAAIAISSVGAVCLVLLAGLLYIMRKRQKRFNYGPRCTPVSLDEYSIDNLSVFNSVTRRKAANRMSKRSYGNPAFDDPSGVSHPLNFPALAKFSRNLEDINAEFAEIPQIVAKTSELPEGCDTKNRYANVIPLPESRVFLKAIEGYPNSDYINANYVTGPKNTKGYYIATQAPMENTVDDFWRMVWEQQSKVILMLTQHFENGLEKCVDYLPPSEVSDCHRLFGDFQVTLKKREVKEKYIISSLQLKNMVSNSWREVTHFWYLGWPEKGVPIEGNSLIAFLIEARSYMKSATLDNKKDSTNGNVQNGAVQNEINPVVVHCSPGTGRTGVAIACDIAIREFEKSRLVDVPKIVYKIRRDRASAVQTKEQYQLIYKVVSLYAMKLTGEVLES